MYDIKELNYVYFMMCKQLCFDNWHRVHIVRSLKGMPLLQFLSNYGNRVHIKHSYYYLSIVYKYASLFVDGT